MARSIASLVATLCSAVSAASLASIATVRRRGSGGNRLLGAWRIIIEAAPGLAAEPPRLDQLLLDDRRGEARIAEIARMHTRGDGEIHVMADEIHELERAHAEAARLAHD